MNKKVHDKFYLFYQFTNHFVYVCRCNSVYIYMHLTLLGASLHFMDEYSFKVIFFRTYYARGKLILYFMCLFQFQSATQLIHLVYKKIFRESHNLRTKAATLQFKKKILFVFK